jgi:hypothetical protein
MRIIFSINQAQRLLARGSKINLIRNALNLCTIVNVDVRGRNCNRAI